MTTPVASIPLPNTAAPTLDAARQTASAKFFPIIPNQDEFIKILRNPLPQSQEEVAREVAEYVGIPFSSGLGAPAEDMGWIGGAYGMLELFLRKNAITRPLKLKGFTIQLPPSAETLLKAPMKYSSGVVEGPQESLPGEKLTKPFQGLTPLLPDGPGVDWALWFRASEQELLKKQVPVIQWLTTLTWHASPEMEAQINQAQERFIQAEVPRQVLYAVVRDDLLDSVPGRYHPLVYLERLKNIKSGDFNPTALAHEMQRILTFYEAARVRAIFKLEKYPEISAIYAACLYYKRLPKAVAKLIENPS